MAANRTVLGELGNTVVESSKKVRDPMTSWPKRKEWLEVLEKASEAYAAICKASCEDSSN